MNGQPCFVLRLKGGARAAALGGLLALAAPAAVAVTFETENVKGSFDSTISFGMQWRMSATSCGIIGNDNGGCAPTTGTLGELVNGPDFGATSNPDFNYLQSDNGNLNYKKNQLISAALKGNHELALRFKDGWSALGRFSWLYDPATDNTERTPLTDDAKNIAVHNLTLLDVWLAKDFEVGDQPAKVKVGNQVLSWGEDIFIYGGINIINPIDLTRAHKPGVQLKEIFRPAPMASFNLRRDQQPVASRASGSSAGTRSVSTRWERRSRPVTWSAMASSRRSSRAPCSARRRGPSATSARSAMARSSPPASASRYEDLLAAGTVVPVLPTQSPPNTNQFGFAARYKPDNSDAEWGFYYLHYNDKIPFIGFVNDPAITANPFGLGYFLQYGKNRDLFGVSVNGHLGDWAVGAELSYRPRDGVAIDPTVPLAGQYCAFCAAGTYPGYVDSKKWQAHLTTIYLLGPSGELGWLLRGLGAAEGTLLLEVAAAYYPDLDFSGQFPYLLPNYELPTRFSSGTVFELGIVYPHAFGTPVNLTPQIDIAYDISGISPNTIPFVKGRLGVTPSLNFEYLNKWRASLAYTSFAGGAGNNLMRDRDYISFNVSYAF